MVRAGVEKSLEDCQLPEKSLKMKMRGFLLVKSLNFYLQFLNLGE